MTDGREEMPLRKSTPDPTPDATLAGAVSSGDFERLVSIIRGLHAGEVARTVSRLPLDLQARMLELLGPDEAARVLGLFEDEQAAEIIERLPADGAAAIIGELPSNDGADLLSELDAQQAETILRVMDPATAVGVRTLATYEPHAAGGLMITEVLAYDERTTVGEVVADLRAHADTYADFSIQYIYVVGPKRELVGVLKLRDLLLGPPGTRLRRVMISDPITVDHLAELDQIRDLFDRHPFLGLPVVKNGILLGLVRRAAVEEALKQRNAQTFRLVQGIVGGEEFRTMPLVRRSARRLSWLSVNIGLNVVAAGVIVLFEDTLSRVIALAAFLPIISDMSGCSGNQAVAVSMRELALGLIEPREVGRVWVKEVSVGLVNGLALGTLLGLVAWLWRGNGYLGLVVGGALALNTVVAVSIGGSIPLLLKRLGFDPALASGPILTTVTDMCGFLFALGFATWMLHLL
jgi:magnesium transporter